MKSGAFLSIMTDFHHGLKNMQKWYYSVDPTHVTFYSIKTIHWIANYFNLELIHTDGERVVVLKKSSNINLGEED